MTVAIDPVLIYTINYSFNTLHEKLNVYMRTGSIMTVYAVAIDPVLVYTITFSFNTLHEKLNVYMRTGSIMTVYAVAIDPVLVYTITFSFNTLHEKLNVYMRTGSIMTVYAVPSDPVLVYTITFSFNTLHEKLSSMCDRAQRVGRLRALPLPLAPTATTYRSLHVSIACCLGQNCVSPAVAASLQVCKEADRFRMSPVNDATEPTAFKRLDLDYLEVQI